MSAPRVEFHRTSSDGTLMMRTASAPSVLVTGPEPPPRSARKTVTAAGVGHESLSDDERPQPGPLELTLETGKLLRAGRLTDGVVHVGAVERRANPGA